jgi:DNA-binding NarL/FixJ family response regulator
MKFSLVAPGRFRRDAQGGGCRVLVDDYNSVRQMLGLVLEREGGYTLAGEARTGFEALKICARVRPRMVILDLALPELNGLELLRRLRADSRDVRVLVYTGTDNREMILETLRERPHGFVHKRDPLAILREALLTVTSGGSFLTPFATDLLDAARGTQPAAKPLSERERSVLQMVAEGMSNKEMASRLGIAPKTVEHHRATLMEKLDLHDVARLTRYALRMGVVAADE